MDRTVTLAAQEDVPSCRVGYFAAPDGQDWLTETRVGQVLAGQVVQIKPK
jgi:hypothetical protein